MSEERSEAPRKLAVHPELLDPSDQQIHVTIEGVEVQVPAGNSVLRILQALDFDLYACRLCWNGDCDNCHFSHLEPGSGAERTVRGCETTACDGMTITRLPLHAQWPAGSQER